MIPVLAAVLGFASWIAAVLLWPDAVSVLLVGVGLFGFGGAILLWPQKRLRPMWHASTLVVETGRGKHRLIKP